MKKLLSLLSITFIAASVFAQTETSKAVSAPPATTSIPPITFSEVKHDFGKIKQGVPVTFDFAFKNVSKKPVVIESATATCGCTTPVKPEAPVAKGKSSKITAGFNAAAAGPFEKTITVKVKDYANPIEIKITGQVLSAEEYTKFEEEKTKKSRR